jgi:hypothetical protein
MFYPFLLLLILFTPLRLKRDEYGFEGISLPFLSHLLQINLEVVAICTRENRIGVLADALWFAIGK